jgi:predicted ATPase
MRLDKIKIGSAKDSATHCFKNLKDITIDFDQGEPITVVIGWNGTGKSNVLEALAILFRDLIVKKRTPQFAFILDYRMGVGDDVRYINIDSDPDRKNSPYIIHITKQEEAEKSKKILPLFKDELPKIILKRRKVSLNVFFSQDEFNLPRHVFGYYSGESTRMYDIFRPYLEKYDRELRGGKDPGLKRLFFAMPVHSQFVLLAFIINQNKVVAKFLADHLGLDSKEGIESVLFILRQPPWKIQHPDGDPRVWYARGIVRDFLARLYDISLAPIRLSRRVPVSLWNKRKLEFLYLYIKDVDGLRSLVGERTPADFFRDLESTYVSELIEGVRIRVKLKQNDGSVTFRELSEGEQQLLTVLGLLRFTAEEESLFLLDEPDTHLNPSWSVNFLGYLKSFVGTEKKGFESSHIILTTHNPMAIAELSKAQVQILHRNNKSRSVDAENPEIDPKGMGYAGIITSDMFGLGSSLDKPTNDDLISLHKLATAENLTESEKIDLKNLRSRLQNLDFNFASRDRLEQEYLRARFDLSSDKSFEGPIITEENKAIALEALITSLLTDLSEG